MSSPDLLFSLRQLTKRPGLTVAIILIMAAGIGINAAVFSVVYTVLLKPLPYPDPQQLVFISGTSGTGENIPVSLPNFRDWQAQQHSFENIAAYHVEDWSLLVNGETQHCAGAFVSAGYFQTLGLVPRIGRGFLDSEDLSGSDRVVVISERLWRDQFASDPDILGRTLVINAISYRVIGVAPDQVMHPANIDLYASLGPFSNYPMWSDRGNPTLYAIGRLKAGVPLSAASTDLKLVCKNLELRFPDTNAGHSARLNPLLETTVAEYRTTLCLLLAAAGSILIISSANVAGLQLIRVSDRRKEFTVRTALGASRGDIIKQLLVENLIVTFIGGFLGIVAASWSHDLISALFPQNIPRFQAARIDAVVVVVMMVVAIGTGLGSGLCPAWKTSNIKLSHTLRAHEAASPGVERHRSQKLLVVCQIAIVTVLLAGTGLLIQTLRALHEVNLGFDPNQVLVIGLKLPGARYRDLPGDEGGRRIATLYERILDKVEGVSGVESAAISNNPPFVHTPIQSRLPFGIHGRPDPKPGDEPFAECQSVSPDYFRTLRLPLLRGRLFDEHDIFGRTLVVIVDQNFVDRLFPNENPIGRQIHDSGPLAERSQYQIVGVVPTVRHDELGAEPRLVQLYFPAGQSAYLQVRMLVRTNGQPNSFLRPIRDAVSAIDPEVPVFEALSMTDALSAQLAQQQLAMDLISVFSVLALVLAIIGLYGVLAQTVSQRTREIGVRMTLGASPRRVLGLILGKGMLLVGIGLVIGLAAETGLTPLYRSFLYEVTPTDLTTLLLTAAVLGVAAFLGCLAPALRAANLDPVEALRER
jgi:putative ABC transport system permease protein